MKRILSFLLAAVLVFSILPSMPIPETNAAGQTISDAGVAFIKSMEGFSKYPTWDYGQYSVGYGCAPLTNADLQKWFEVGITEEEADALMRAHLENFEAAVNSFAEKCNLSLSQNQFDALVSFSYNLGTAWMNETGNFRSAVINGSTGNSFLCAIVRYCHADGSILTGLVKRRLCEADIYLNGKYGSVFPEYYSYVYFNARGGTCADVQAFENSNPLTSKDFPKPVKNGFSFGGWYDAISGGKLVTELSAAFNGKYLYADWGGTAVDPTPTTTPTACTVTVSVTGDVVNIRAGCGTDYAITRTVIKGDTLEITGVSEWNGANWGQLSSGEWICLTYTNYRAPESAEEETTVPDKEDEKESELCRITVTGSAVNIRKGAGTNYAVMSVSQKGQMFAISAVETVNNTKWGKIIDGGWICLRYTNFTDSMLEPKEQEPDATEPDTPEEPEQTEQPEQIEQPEESSGEPTDNGEPGKDIEGDSTEPGKDAETGTSESGKDDSGNTNAPTEPEKESESEKSEPEEAEPSATEDPSEKPTGEFTVTVTGSALNVRNTPGTTGTIAGLVLKGDVLTIVETQMVGDVNWGRVKGSGWVCLTYTTHSQSKPAQETTVPNNPSGGSQQPTTPEASPVQSSNETGTVTASALRIRSGPGVSYAITGSLSRGSIVTILDIQKINGTEWGRISGGWISLQYVSRQGGTAIESNGSYVVTGNLVNIRDNPGYSGKVLKTVSSGTTLSISKTADCDGLSWGYAADVGWICLKYVKKK